MTGDELTGVLLASLARTEAELRDRAAAMTPTEVRERLVYIDLIRAHLDHAARLGSRRAAQLLVWRLRGAMGPVVVEGGGATGAKKVAAGEGGPRGFQDEGPPPSPDGPPRA